MMDQDLLRALPIVGAWLARLEALHIDGVNSDDDEVDTRLPDSIMTEWSDPLARQHLFENCGDIARFLVEVATALQEPQRPLFELIEGGKG